jgi:transcriptional regulatory protein AMDR
MCYVGTDVSNLHFLIRQRERTKGVHHFPTLQFSRRVTAYEPSLIPHDAFVMPDKALADELISSYFKHVAPGFPIIDESLFMAQYNSRDPADPPSLLVLQAIMLVGAHVSKPQPERDGLKAMFFRRAKLLLDARYERDRLFVVQAALLLTWHSDGAEDITANCWHYVGMAARAATGLGMHCDVKPSRLVPHDKRTWRRVWWILVQFDVLTSLSYGRPQSM